MAGLKTAGERLIWIAGIFNGTTYLAMHTGDPTDSNELSGNGYARVSMAESDWTINAGNGSVSNASVKDFPEATGTWGDPTHFSVYDAATGGNMLISGTFSNNINAPVDGIQLTINAGALVVSATTG